MFKYIILNLLKAKKLYLPLLLIISLILFVLMCSFSIRTNINTVYEKQFNKYSVVAIHQNGAWDGDEEYIYMDENFIEKYKISENIEDYYAFRQRWAQSETLEAIPTDIPITLQNSFFRSQYDNEFYFVLMVYSDISKSYHFRTGDRKIVEGRFAENVNECNISEELAELNNLFVGDDVELIIGQGVITPRIYTFKIVGIYEDNTDEINNELPTVIEQAFTMSDINGIPFFDVTTISENNISLNQILITVYTYEEFSRFDFVTAIFKNGEIIINEYNPENDYYNSDDDYAQSFEEYHGYDTVVYYTHSAKDALLLNDELNGVFPEQFVAMSSSEILRAIIRVFEGIEKSFIWILVIAGVICGIFSIFIILYVLKERTYDIGVFRSRGMSRVKTGFMFSGEIIITSFISFVLSGILYILFFPQILKKSYEIITDAINSFGQGLDNYVFGNIINEIRAYNDFVYTTPQGIFISLLVTIIFSVIIGLVTILFISRYEPMKTMTEH